MTSKETSRGGDALEWFERCGDYLFAYATVRVRSRDAAEDLVQETFLAAIQAKNAFAGKSSEKTWLTGILKHKIYDYYRRHSRQVDLSDDLDLSDYKHFFERDDEWNGHWNAVYAPAEWSDGNPFRQVAESEFQKIFSGCLAGLPERTASAFVMREVDGLDAAEICEVLMITAKNYWTMMYRARLHLRRCIEINWFTAPDKAQKTVNS